MVVSFVRCSGRSRRSVRNVIGRGAVAHGHRLAVHRPTVRVHHAQMVAAALVGLSDKRQGAAVPALGLLPDHLVQHQLLPGELDRVLKTGPLPGTAR